MTDHLTVPGLIGEHEQYKTVSQYIKIAHESFTSKIALVERKSQEQVDSKVDELKAITRGMTLRLNKEVPEKIKE